VIFDNFVNIRQTSGFAKFLEFFHWKTINPKANVFYFVRKIPLLGSVIKIEKINLQNIDLKEIDEIAKNNHALFVKIEPFAEELRQKELDDLFFPHAYTRDTWPLSSTASYVVDLSEPYEKIVANFKSKFRYNLRLAENKNALRFKVVNGLTLYRNATHPEEQSDEGAPRERGSLLEQFAEIYNSRAKEIKSGQHSFKELLHMCESYGEKLWMIYVKTQKPENPNSKQILNSKFQIRNSDIVMASFFLQAKDILHYWHNGSTQEGRKLFAPTLVIAEGIKLGQKLGCKMFEFEGIYDERFKTQTKRWVGFTKFKEGFNGEKVIYARPYIKYYSPIFKFFHLLKMI
jgi:lipid II:glycine glycyltransferase (peptidoglycan interpeptide bridge formation enzyme)